MKIKIKKIEPVIIFIVILMVIGAFLRLYRLEELMRYLGDEGRDMLIVMDMIEGKNFPFIGPPTSVGKLYLGPIYYYFIAPFAWAYKMSPVGPAFFVVLTGIFSIPLIYLVGKNYFNKFSGLISAVFLTFSPLMVEFSRSSWNPNPMPFFTLLLLLFLYHFNRNKKPRYLYLSVVSFSIMLQLHYLVLLMLPFLCFVVIKIGFKKIKMLNFLLALAIFIALLSPLFLFDLKHQFINLKGISEIFHVRTFYGFSLIDILSRSRDRLRQIFALFFSFPERSWQNNLLVLFSVFGSAISWFKQKNNKLLILFGWFLWGILITGLYKDSVYPHYLGFLFILPVLLEANLLAIFWNSKITGKILATLIFGLLLLIIIRATWINLNRPPVLNVDLVKKIVNLINAESNDKPFNFALLANNNYDDSYRYFFRLWGMPASYKTEVTEQLFVVCEDLEICYPEGNPKWEIALFDAAYEGKIKIANIWQPDLVIKVFKFIPKDNN